jgi:hypothetical protein
MECKLNIISSVLNFLRLSRILQLNRRMYFFEEILMKVFMGQADAGGLLISWAA